MDGNKEKHKQFEWSQDSILIASVGIYNREGNLPVVPDFISLPWTWISPLWVAILYIDNANLTDYISQDEYQMYQCSLLEF